MRCTTQSGLMQNCITEIFGFSKKKLAFIPFVKHFGLNIQTTLHTYSKSSISSFLGRSRTISMIITHSLHKKKFFKSSI